MLLRVVLAGAGILLGLFGVSRLPTEASVSALAILAIWLIGAIVIRDGILSPLVLGIGWTVARFVPPRARRYLQGALVSAALVTVVAVPMISREGSPPATKALLQQNFRGNLIVLVAILGAVSLAAYAVRVARDHATRRPSVREPSPEEAARPRYARR